MSSKD